jgi:phage replication-related protein YjqB (UPF0714/DUF867 family)
MLQIHLDSNKINHMYNSIDDLQRNEIDGINYKILCESVNPDDILIIGIHGGSIEPGISEIVKYVASDKYSYYLFEGISKKNNYRLHISSDSFSEKRLNQILHYHSSVLSLHGCADEEEIVYFGGKDIEKINIFTKEFIDASYIVGKTPIHLSGKSALNVVNRNISGKGIQIEISNGLREKMFKDLSSTGRTIQTEYFLNFCNTLNNCLQKIKV